MDRPKAVSRPPKAQKSKVPTNEALPGGGPEASESVGKTAVRSETGRSETAGRTEAESETIKSETAGTTETVGQALVRAARMLDDLAVGRLRKKSPEARASHTRLLPYIEAEGTRLTTLADRLGVTKQAIGQLVEELEGQGLLLREPDPDDGRAKRVKLTARGKRAMQDGLAQLGLLEAMLAASLGEKRMSDFGATLMDAIQCLEAESAKG
jgi:DNA-binding MarR family transcriptional regulator